MVRFAFLNEFVGAPPLPQNGRTMLLLRLLRVLLFGRPRQRHGGGDGGGRWLAGLRFPVLVIHDGASVSVCEGSEGLARMHVNRVVLAREAPIVIDAELNLYRLERLRSTRSGLWLVTHPSGETPVAFERFGWRPGARTRHGRRCCGALRSLAVTPSWMRGGAGGLRARTALAGSLRCCDRRRMRERGSRAQESVTIRFPPPPRA
jgi:hypothetical protein